MSECGVRQINLERQVGPWIRGWGWSRRACQALVASDLRWFRVWGQRNGHGDVAAAEGAGERAARSRVLGEPLPDWFTEAAAGWELRRLRRTGGGPEGRDSGKGLVVGVARGIIGAKRGGAASG